jgi:hypothetical protein
MMLLGIFNFCFCFSFFYLNACRLDLTIEPWIQGLWPALKETLTKIGSSTETSINNLSESINQLSLIPENKPTVDRQLSSSNKFKSTEDSITYSSNFSQLTTVTLPPKSIHSLSIKLIESTEVILIFPNENINLYLFYFKDKTQFSSDLPYHISSLTRRECLTHDSAIKPVMSIDLQLSVC